VNLLALSVRGQDIRVSELGEVAGNKKDIDGDHLSNLAYCPGATRCGELEEYRLAAGITERFEEIRAQQILELGAALCSGGQDGSIIAYLRHIANVRAYRRFVKVGELRTGWFPLDPISEA
jgi:hypothetical protein